VSACGLGEILNGPRDIVLKMSSNQVTTISAMEPVRTARKRGTGNPVDIAKFIDAGAQDAFKRPWHRLERGLRLNRLRAFTEEERTKMSLTQYETASLLGLLQKALDKRQLNSKMNVVYDQEAEKILEIKGLVMHRGADGYMKFQILEKKTGTVRRKRDDAAAAGGTGAPGQVQATPDITEGSQKA
jgi:hypothetical protein